MAMYYKRVDKGKFDFDKELKKQKGNQIL